LNGAAAKNACEILRKRLAPVAMALLQAMTKKTGEPDLTRASSPDDKATAERADTAYKSGEENLVFADGFVFLREAHAPSRVLSDAASESGNGRNVRREARRTAPEAGALPEHRVSFVEVVRKAYLERVSLSTTGFYATPGIHWDRAAGRGKPFHYFANGAAVTEVEVDGFTGMHRVLRVDILHDVGDSVNEGVNRGQIEGGFVQGMGWLTAEELKWNDKGVLLTHSPDTYKIPSVGDTPQIFNVALLKDATQKSVVHGSKAVGEPPLMLAISVREAIRDAVAAFGLGKGEVALASPATCEAIWMAIQKIKKTSVHKESPSEIPAMAK
jgi:xanthine dehydrogenase molybdopterin-binding subunit B